MEEKKELQNQDERVVEIELERLRGFVNHPFLNAQNVYHIMDDGDKQKETQMSQEKDALSLEIKEYISRQDAAELAGVSVSTVTKWVQSKGFQCIGAGKVLRVHGQQFLNWLEENREGVM